MGLNKQFFFEDSERDWPEDYEHENGCYLNRCMYCEQMFTGYKRRVVCKVCYKARESGND